MHQIFYFNSTDIYLKIDKTYYNLVYEDKHNFYLFPYSLLTLSYTFDYDFLSLCIRTRSHPIVVTFTRTHLKTYRIIDCMMYQEDGDFNRTDKFGKTSKSPYEQAFKHIGFIEQLPHLLQKQLSFDFIVLLNYEHDIKNRIDHLNLAFFLSNLSFKLEIEIIYKESHSGKNNKNLKIRKSNATLSKKNVC